MERITGRGRSEGRKGRQKCVGGYLYGKGKLLIRGERETERDEREWKIKKERGRERKKERRGGQGEEWETEREEGGGKIKKKRRERKEGRRSG